MRQILTQRSAIGLSLLVMSAAAWGWTRPASLSAPSPEPAGATDQRPLPVQTRRLQAARSYQRMRLHTGVLRAARVSELGLERTGRVIEVLVDEGDAVLQGDVLARLDTRSLQAQGKELAARKLAAEAMLAELQAGPRAEVIAAAQAEVNQLAADQKLEEANLARSERLVNNRALSQAEYDRAIFGAEAAQARRDAAQRRLDELQAGSRSEKIDAQRGVVQQLEASLEQLRVALEDSELRAPFDGIVARRRVDEGAIVSPGVPLIRLLESQHLEAWIGLPAADAYLWSEGESTSVEVAGADYPARVGAVLPELDEATRTRTLILELQPDNSRSLAPAMVARLATRHTVTADGYWAPTASLSRGDRGLWSVSVAALSTDGVWRVERRDVEVLHQEGEQSYLRGTIQDGESLIVSGVHRLAPGQPVTID